MDERELTKTLSKFVALVSTRLPDDVLEALRSVAASADDLEQRQLFQMMFDNLERARSEKIPICQDTGTPYFHVKMGTRSPFINCIGRCLREAVAIATLEVPLRPNAVDPFTGMNLGTNIPWIDYELMPDSDEIEIWLHMAGGGSSLLGRSTVLKPLERVEGMAEFLIETLVRNGVNACPPLFLGIGIGATMEISAILAKRALLKPVGRRSEDPKVARIEETLLSDLNELAIGIQGMGLGRSILDIHVEHSARHPTTFAIGISANCWVFRKGAVRLYPDGGFEILTHRGAEML
ncbi:MAG: fumarate hydratase [Nitrososphaerota archaeon]|nr:fumarate hydratase [Nitrososphaerota archaeon]